MLVSCRMKSKSEKFPFIVGLIYCKLYHLKAAINLNKLIKNKCLHVAFFAIDLSFLLLFLLKTSRSHKKIFFSKGVNKSVVKILFRKGLTNPSLGYFGRKGLTNLSKKGEVQKRVQ